MEPFLSILFAVFCVTFVVFVLVCNIVRPRQILNRWAQGNDYQIPSSHYCWFRRGPFFWTTSKGQCIYRVTVRTLDGLEKQGWVRCGGWFLGVLSDHAEVRWDE
jgi:hypothetical protein